MNTNSIKIFLDYRSATLREMISELLLSDGQFDSHDFIESFRGRFELDYVGFLSNYKSAPFRIVHAQISLYLAKNAQGLGIKKNGKVRSKSIFGREVENEEWLEAF